MISRPASCSAPAASSVSPTVAAFVGSYMPWTTRNLQLLKERSWFYVPLVYANQRLGTIAIEKGAPGERAFEDAFTAWGEDYPTVSTDAHTRVQNSPGSGRVGAVAHTGWIIQVGSLDSE